MDDRNQMDRRYMWIPWAVTSLVLLVVAVVAFRFGGRYDRVVVNGADVVHGHFGFFGIFFVMFLWFFVFGGLRRMWWWGGYPYHRPWRYRRFYRDPYDDEREFEEWHRRAHERMGEHRGRGPSGAPDAGNGDSSRRD